VDCCQKTTAGLTIYGCGQNATSILLKEGKSHFPFPTYNPAVPRIGKRITVTRGVYRDSGGHEVRVVIAGITYSERLPLDSTLTELKQKRAALEAQGRTATPKAARGTLQAAVPTYLQLVAHLASADDLEDHLRAWCDRLGDVQRHRLTDRDVSAARAAWLAEGLSPKTINNRVGTLRNLYRRLDGKRAATPCDDLAPLAVPRRPIQRVSDALILAVDLKLQEHEQDGRHSVLKNGHTRARYRVLMSMGRRPCEVMRTQPADLNLTARVWVPRDAKGGYTPGLYLNDDQLAAWTLFDAVNAYGPFNLGSFVRTIRAAGWPADVKVYQARHTYGIAMSEAGIDLSDVGTALGHRPGSRVTRSNYVPILNSRLQRAAEAVDGRFGGFSVVPESVPSRKRKRTR
jgi:site-specific recombinase XerD